MTANIDVVASWLEGLAARGVTVGLRNNRLWLRPASAYRNLTDDEVLVLRHHRAAIKQRVYEGLAPAASLASTNDPNVPPRPCAYCYQDADQCARLHARDLPTWRTLHANEPVEAARRINEANVRANAEMAASFRRQQAGHTEPLDFIIRRQTCDSAFDRPPAASAARPITPTRSAPPARRARAGNRSRNPPTGHSFRPTLISSHSTR